MSGFILILYGMKKAGYIDLHTHGTGRYDTRTTNASDILMMAELQGRAGVSAILPTIYAGPIEGMRKNIETVSEAMRMQGPPATGPAGNSCRVLGVNLEGPFLNPLRCGALDRDAFIKPSISNLRRLIEGFEVAVKIITVAPEFPGALKVIEKCAQLGIRVNMGHSDASLKQALDGKKAGATGITHLFNAMRPMHHREPGLAGLGLLDEDIYIEVVADGIHIHPDMLKLIFRVKPPERIILVSDSIKGPIYKNGVLQGAKRNLADGVKFLTGLGLPQKSILMAASDNPKRYLKY